MSVGAATPVRVMGRPDDRLAPDVGEVIDTVTGYAQSEDGRPKNCVSRTSLNRVHDLLTSGPHLNSVQESV